MINPLDLKPHIDVLLHDVWMAIQAEESILSYEYYLEGLNNPDAPYIEDDAEINAISERINKLKNLENMLKWYGENLQRLHR